MSLTEKVGRKEACAYYGMPENGEDGDRIFGTEEVKRASERNFSNKFRENKQRGKMQMEDKLTKLKKVLLKQAVGFEKTETLTEYQADGKGKFTTVKKKVQKKYFPPDLQAMKAYLELEKGVNLSAMSDEELQKEKIRLLSELEKINKEKEKC